MKRIESAYVELDLVDLWALECVSVEGVADFDALHDIATQDCKMPVFVPRSSDGLTLRTSVNRFMNFSYTSS